jgi:hypothetical protein
MTEAASPDTANVGLDVSLAFVLMRNSPRTITAEALLRLRVSVRAVKFVETVMSVVELASFAPPRRNRQDVPLLPVDVMLPKPLEASTTAVSRSSLVSLRVEVNAHPVTHLSWRLPENVTVIVSPVFRAEVALVFQTEHVTPLPAAPSPLVNSPNFSHVLPAESCTCVTSLPSVSVVVVLSDDTTMIASSPMETFVVAVVRASVELFVLDEPVPIVPFDVIDIVTRFRGSGC